MSTVIENEFLPDSLFDNVENLNDGIDIITLIPTTIDNSVVVADNEQKQQEMRELIARIDKRKEEIEKQQRNQNKG